MKMILCERCGHDMSGHRKFVSGVILVTPCKNCLDEEHELNNRIDELEAEIMELEKELFR